MADAVSVDCPDCYAPTGEPCRSDYDTPHADRQRLADLRALEQGVCALCGAWMVRGSVEGSPIDAWHPDPTAAAACPPIPDPTVDWNAYATTINLGLTPGHPGVEHFISNTPEPAGLLRTDWAICPECIQGKHDNCAHEALNDHDEFVVCACEKGAHR